VRRRQFILLCFGAATTRPRAACAQKSDRVRRVGVLMAFGAGDAEGLHRARVFSQRLQDLGWVDGQNVQVEYRWPDGDIEQIQALAKELVGSRPHALVAGGAACVKALQQATRSTPIVFVMSDDPVSEGIVESLARPGGNATGFAAFEASMSGKWLELLKEIVAGLMRVAVILPPDSATAGISYLHSIQTAAASPGISRCSIWMRAILGPLSRYTIGRSRLRAAPTYRRSPMLRRCPGGSISKTSRSATVGGRWPIDGPCKI
jgi:putative tryptophan/tyrosine transport system substrate-binding protein